MDEAGGGGGGGFDWDWGCVEAEARDWRGLGLVGGGGAFARDLLFAAEGGGGGGLSLVGVVSATPLSSASPMADKLDKALAGLGAGMIPLGCLTTFFPLDSELVLSFGTDSFISGTSSPSSSISSISS